MKKKKKNNKHSCCVLTVLHPLQGVEEEQACQLLQETLLSSQFLPSVYKESLLLPVWLPVSVSAERGSLEVHPPQAPPPRSRARPNPTPDEGRLPGLCAPPRYQAACCRAQLFPSHFFSSWSPGHRQGWPLTQDFPSGSSPSAPSPLAHCKDHPPFLWIMVGSKLGKHSPSFSFSPAPYEAKIQSNHDAILFHVHLPSLSQQVRDDMRHVTVQ